MNLNTLSFQDRLILAFNVIVVCAVGVVGVTGIWLIRRQMLDHLHEELSKTLEAVKKDLTLDTERLLKQTEPLAAHFDIRRAVLLATNEPSDPLAVSTALGRLGPSSGLDFIEVWDREGRLLARRPRLDDLPSPASSPAWAIALTGSASVGYDVRPTESLTIAVCTAYAPIKHLDGLIGVVVGGRHLDQTYLSAFRQRFHQEVVLQLDQETLATTQPEGSARFTYKKLALTPSPLPLELGFGVSAAPLQTAYLRLQQSFLLMLCLGILIASWMAIRLSRRITRPLEQLTAAVQQGGEHALTPAAVTTSATGEIAVLVEAYNRLVHDLEVSRERLIHSERLAAWRDVARRIAHEIKNPLMPIHTAVESLRRHRDHPEFPKLLDQSTTVILQEIDRLKQFVNEFAQFARLPQFRFEPADVNRLVKAVGHLHAPLNPKVTLNYDLGEMGSIPLDASQLTAALTNLVKNAYEAMPEGGTVTLKTRLLPAPGGTSRLQIECEDTGPGLSPEARAKLFTPYFTTKASGTGLGLAMVHEIVRAHEGTIRVENGLTHGTRIVITI